MAAINFKDSTMRSKSLKDLHRRILHDPDPKALTNYLAVFADLRASAARAGVPGVAKSYSAYNYALLIAQAGALGESHRHLYAGRRQWLALDREVRDNARPKWVFAPTKPRSAPAPAPAAGQPASANAEHEPARKVYRPFVAVEVFDYTDTVATDGTPEPDWATPFHAGTPEVLDALVATSPLPVCFEDLSSHSEHGFATASRIVIDETRTTGSQISTLCHELGHVRLGHLDRIAELGETARPGCEQEAQLVAWLCMSALGLGDDVGNDVTADTVAYLRSWSDDEERQGNKARFAALNERLETAWAAAAEITSAVEAHLDAGVPA